MIVINSMYGLMFFCYTQDEIVNYVHWVKFLTWWLIRSKKLLNFSQNIENINLLDHLIYK
jgi:hypothetical protein